MAYAGQFPAKDLVPGMMVDLESDPYADPDESIVSYQFCYAIVEAVEQETSTCVVVHFDGSWSIGFPSDHPLNVFTED